MHWFTRHFHPIRSFLRLLCMVQYMSLCSKAATKTQNRTLVFHCFLVLSISKPYFSILPQKLKTMMQAFITVSELHPNKEYRYVHCHVHVHVVQVKTRTNYCTTDTRLTNQLLIFNCSKVVRSCLHVYALSRKVVTVKENFYWCT